MRFVTVLSGVCLLSLSIVRGASAQSGDSLEDVLSAIRTASGAPYRYHLVSTSHERIDGVAYALTSESEDARYSIRRCAGVVCNGLYVDGDRTSVVNINGTALPLPIAVDPLQSSLRAVATGAFAAPEFEANGGRVERESDATGGGVRLQRLVVATAHGAPLDVGIDPSTHLVATVGTRGGKVTFAFKNYRAVDSMMLPFEIDVDGKRNQIFDRRGRADGTLAAPAGLVPQMDGAVSTTLGSARSPIVPCAIGGSSTSCLIDTGNSGMVMSADFARRLGLRAVPSPTLSAFGRTVVGVVRAGALHVAGATFPPALYVVVSNLHAAGADLALGADFFAHALVTIDYPSKTLTVAPESTTVTGAPITFENFVPITGAAIANQALPVSIDTGDDDAVTVPEAFAAARGARSASVRVGDYVLAGASISGTTLLTGAARAHLGSDFLRHFRVSFDYAHERMSLTLPAPDRNVTRAI